MPGDDGNTVVIPLLPPRTAEALAQRGQRRDFRFPENTEQEKKNLQYSICRRLGPNVPDRGENLQPHRFPNAKS